MGRGAVRPGADDRELGKVVAFGQQPLANLARDVGLGSADQRAGGDLLDDAIGGLGRQPEELDLVGVLDHPELAEDLAGALQAGRREPLGDLQDVHRPESVADPEPRERPDRSSKGLGGEPPDERHRIVRLLPARDFDEPPADGRATACRCDLETRGHQGRRTGCRNDEHRQSLERHRVIAGEVVEVRPDADEEGVEPRLRGQPACRGDPLAEAGRRDDRAGRNGGRHRPAISTGSGSPSHAAIVRGPASNSRR